MAAKKRSVTLTLTDLRDLLTPVLPHTDKGSLLPVLGCVQFRVEGRWLLATGTDRYTIGVCRTEVPAGTKFECLVQAAELRSMLAMFKPTRGTEGQAVELTIDGDHLRAKGTSAMFAEATVSYNLYKGEYPKVKQILADLGTEGTFKPTGLNWSLLTKFQHAQRHGQPLVVSGHSPTRPIFVRGGDHFLGAIMPARMGGVCEDWADLFPPAENPKAATA